MKKMSQKQKNILWKNFRKSHSRTAERVIRRVARGFSTKRIAKDLGIPTMSVAAYKANLTANKYAPFAYRDSKGKVQGYCF